MTSIRNFAIIAHIDHGKSTLADRFMETCDLVEKGKHNEQMLDRNPISRERGITIKLAPVRLNYKGTTLNLVDTPGHVDFSYEVDRTLACVEGVILLVDATQGIQAQTIAHTYKALEHNLKIIPVLNKIDRPEAQVAKVRSELANFIGVSEDEVLAISAKTGEGCTELLNKVVEIIPPPKIVDIEAINNKSPQALIFDSYYDPHRGVIAFVRVFNGSITKGAMLELAGNNKQFTTTEVGYFLPELTKCKALMRSEIGYVVTSLKSIKDVRVGDTITSSEKPSRPLPGYKQTKPMVYAFIFPTDNKDYENLLNGMEKLALNDASIQYSAIYSQALGPGLKVGFLGLLHAEIVRERLEQEHDLDLVITPAQVEFEIDGTDFMEPIAHATIITPSIYINNIMQIGHEYRATLLTTDNVNLGNQVVMEFEIPLAELMGNNFFDVLKSVTSGYGSLDWEFLKYQKVAAAKLEIMINLKTIDEFSQIVVEEKSFLVAQKYTNKLAKLIPRQQYEIRIQGKYRNKIIASSRVAPYRKDVTAKLYGGDRSRKDKLLKKQKRGKSALKQIGNVSIPKETFVKLFKD